MVAAVAGRVADVEILRVPGDPISRDVDRLAESHFERHVLAAVPVGVEAEYVERLIAERWGPVDGRGAVDGHRHHRGCGCCGEEIEVAEIQPGIFARRRGVEVVGHNS